MNGGHLVPIHYFLRIPNVGDRANPDLIEAIWGAPAKFEPDRSRQHLLGIGSILQGASDKSIVWGSGLMRPDLDATPLRAENIFALRGELTRQALRRMGCGVGDVPLGDPGYLLPAALGIVRSATPTARVGIAAHYTDRRDGRLRRILSEPGVVDLNVHDDPVPFLRKMSECEVVVSSSLHGLIFATALGIPNAWFVVGDRDDAWRFKFHDWFSTTRSPPPIPHSLAFGDDAGRLARGARIHDCTIDAAALKDAFPLDLFRLAPGGPRPARSVAECRRSPTPVFFISYNRGAMLKHTIEAVRRQARPVEVIVHDNGSTDDDTISALAELERNGVRVYRRNAIQAADQLNETDLTVREYFSDWAEPARYAVTDCDIDMSTASPHAIEVFDELLNRFREIETVGPMLRIRDVNPSYVLFAELMNRHISQFWEREPIFIATSHGQAAFIDTRIDTTFSLHRAGEPFRRGKRALRVYEPYEAAHLDWYPKWSDDKVFADTSSARISHWTNREFRTSRPGVSLRYDRFRAVIAQADGGLEVYDEILRPPPERQSLLGRALRMLSTLAPGSIRRGLKGKGV